MEWFINKFTFLYLFFLPSAALKSLADALASPMFFALHKKKITAYRNAIY